MKFVEITSLSRPPLADALFQTTMSLTTAHADHQGRTSHALSPTSRSGVTRTMRRPSGPRQIECLARAGEALGCSA